MKSTKELLRFKRDGGRWSTSEIATFVRGLCDGSVSEPQAAAFLMAACIHGLTDDETAALTLAMAESGERLEPMQGSRNTIDKHSTGGVGDKVSLLLAPLARACGLVVPMISGRGLGHTGGTVDKLESIPGMNLQLSMDQLSQLRETYGLFMAAQSATLAPADRILYALRDVTGTVENTGLISASILSKKLAEGLNGLVMDVKVGSAAFMKTIEQAETLAASIRSVAALAGLPVSVVFTRMDAPLGYACGNWVEVAEAERSLSNRSICATDLQEVTIELVAQMLVLANVNADIESATARVVECWDSGSAHAEFHHMISRQGGDYQAGEQAFAACPSVDVTARSSGTITSIDAMVTAEGLLDAGAGRKKETDVIDPFAGIVYHKHVGDWINTGDRLATISASNRDCLEPLTKCVLNSVVQKETASPEVKPSMIIQRWTE